MSSHLKIETSPSIDNLEKYIKVWVFLKSVEIRNFITGLNSITYYII